MLKTMRKLKQTMEEARHVDSSELGAELRKMDELNERINEERRRDDGRFFAVFVGLREARRMNDPASNPLHWANRG